MTEKIINYTDKDIKVFESKYKKKAIKKNKKPSFLFLKWLVKDDSKVLKKTVVKLESDIDINDNTKITNVSYEQDLTIDEFDTTIANLLNEIQNPKITDKEKDNIQNRIKELLINNLSNENLTMNTNVNAQDINAQDKLLDTSENYLGFVYFFWSSDTMNFKIIGLRTINPLFEFVNVKQTFYLIKPAMITNDKPIYFCFDKIPYSLHFEIKNDMIILNREFIEAGTTSDIFYFMEKNKNYIRIYGFNRIPLRVWLMFLLILGFCLMFEYMVLSTILRITG